MANQVKIKINKIKDRGPEERLDWRRKYLKRKTERKTEPAPFTPKGDDKTASGPFAALANLLRK